jgi:hypothetical protein
MAYTDIGFDEFLLRKEPGPAAQQDTQLDPLAFDNFVDQISGNKISGGILTSPDGRTKYDLDQGNFIVSNGVQDLINLGLLPDGSIGLLIQDSQGNILMKVSEGEMYLQSPLKTSRMDLIADQYTVRDEKGNLYVLLGKDPKGF